MVVPQNIFLSTGLKQPKLKNHTIKSTISKFINNFAIQSAFNMNTNQSDLQHIRDIMARSTSFLSLSGLSGIGAGFSAILGCIATLYTLDSYGIDYFDGKPNYYSSEVIGELMVIAVVTLISAIASGIWFTYRKSKKQQLPIWNTAARQLLLSLALPLITGGLFCLILTSHGLFYLVAPCMLIFYGLALISGAKHTLRELYWLGIMEIVLGLLASIFVGYGLVFWGIGFGVLHIFYGVAMYNKYK